MVKHFSAILATLVLVAVLAAPTLAADSPKAQVLAADKAYREARARGDFKALDKMLTPDFTSVHDGKAMTRAQFLTWVEKGKNVFHTWGPASEFAVQFHGTTAILTGEQRLAGRFDVIQGHENKEIKLLTRVTRVWVKTPQGWKCAHFIWHTVRKEVVR